LIKNVINIVIPRLQTSAIGDGTLNSYNLNFEQHASVSVFEDLGLKMIGFDIVNVAQNLQINFSNGELNVMAATYIFPSATLEVNEFQLFKYKEPSYKMTHGTVDGVSQDNGKGGIEPKKTQKRPGPAFYIRYNN